MERGRRGVQAPLTLVELDEKWLTKNSIFCNILLTLFSEASNERITLMVGRATANGCMIEHLAFRVISTDSRTRVYALLVFASFVERTIRADNTFRMTCRRSANVTDATGTNSVAV